MLLLLFRSLVVVVVVLDIKKMGKCKGVRKKLWKILLPVVNKLIISQEKCI